MLIDKNFLSEWCGQIRDAAYVASLIDGQAPNELNSLPSLTCWLEDGGTISTWLDGAPALKRGTELRVTVAEAIERSLADTPLDASLLDEETDLADLTDPTKEVMQAWNYHAAVGTITATLRSIEDGKLGAKDKQQDLLRIIDMLAGAVDSDPLCALHLAKRMIKLMSGVMEDGGVWLYLNAVNWFKTLDSQALEAVRMIEASESPMLPTFTMDDAQERLSEVYNPALPLVIATHSGGAEEDITENLTEQLFCQKMQMIDDSLTSMQKALAQQARRQPLQPTVEAPLPMNGWHVAVADSSAAITPIHIADVSSQLTFDNDLLASTEDDWNSPPTGRNLELLRAAIAQTPAITDVDALNFYMAPQSDGCNGASPAEVEEGIINRVRDWFFDAGNDDELCIKGGMQAWIVANVRGALALAMVEHTMAQTRSEVCDEMLRRAASLLDGPYVSDAVIELIGGDLNEYAMEHADQAYTMRSSALAWRSANNNGERCVETPAMRYMAGALVDLLFVERYNRIKGDTASADSIAFYIRSMSEDL